MNFTELVKNHRDLAVIILLVVILMNLLMWLPFYRIDPHSENKQQYFYGHNAEYNENTPYIWNRNIQSGLPQYDQVFWGRFPYIYQTMSSPYFYAVIISLGSIAIYLILRISGYRAREGILCALVYGLSAHFLEFLPVWTYGWTLIYLFFPWIFYFLKRIKTKSSLFDIVLLSLLLSLSFLLFEIEILVYLIFITIIYLLYSLFDSIDDEGGLWHYLVFSFHLVIAFVLSLSIAAKPYYYLIKVIHNNGRQLIEINIWRLAVIIAVSSVLLMIIRLNRKKLALYLGMGLLILADGYVLISYLPDISDYKQYSISADHSNSITEHLKADTTQFRIYALGKTFNSNAVSSNFQSIGGRSNYPQRRYQDMIKRCLTAEIDKNLPINWHLLGLLNVRYLLSENKIPSSRLEYIDYNYKDKKILYLIKEHSPYAWFPSKLELLGASDIADKINKPEYKMLETAMIESEISGFIIDEYPAPSDKSSVDPVTITPHYLKIRTKNSQPGLLVISEIFDEQGYWQAYVDSLKSQIHRVNYILRGVVIPAGDHVLEMHFELPKRAVLEKISYWAKLMILILLLTEIISKLWIRLNE